MIAKILHQQDIAETDAECIVNASNGIGFMGGKRCIKKKCKGVAESIQFVSQGEIEALSRKQCKQKGVLGFAPGEVCVTEAPTMSTKYIVHATTMRLPGCKAKYATIKKLLPQIVDIVEQLNVHTVAIPLLGTGTGGLSKDDVMDYMRNALQDSPIEFWIYC